ncbi:hypothetical protein HZS_8115 [Henneguya salminicola]|nr:hypothetical protein HZS_8115 [Henneguya salminicola]
MNRYIELKGLLLAYILKEICQQKHWLILYLYPPENIIHSCMREFIDCFESLLLLYSRALKRLLIAEEGSSGRARANQTYQHINLCRDQLTFLD